MSFGDYLENALLNYVLGSSLYTPPSTIYVALSTQDPGETGSTIAEPPALDGYSRKAVTNDATSWPITTTSQKSNGVSIVWNTVTGDWGIITHFALFDDPTAGNMLARGALTTPRQIYTDDEVFFGIGTLTISLD